MYINYGVYPSIIIDNIQLLERIISTTHTVGIVTATLDGSEEIDFASARQNGMVATSFISRTRPHTHLLHTDIHTHTHTLPHRHTHSLHYTNFDDHVFLSSVDVYSRADIVLRVITA